MNDTEVQSPTMQLGMDEFVLRDRDGCRIRAVSYGIDFDRGTVVFYGSPLDPPCAADDEHDIIEVSVNDGNDPMYIGKTGVPRYIAQRIQGEFLVRRVG